MEGNLKDFTTWIKEISGGLETLPNPVQWQLKAAEMELTGADLQKCRVLANQHTRNARKDEHNNLWENALGEWKTALDFDASESSRYVDFAEARYRSYSHTGNLTHLQESRRILRYCLLRFPGNTAARKRLRAVNTVLRQARGKQRLFIAFIIGLIMAVLALAFRGPLTILLKRINPPKVQMSVEEDTTPPRLVTGSKPVDILNRSDTELEVEVSRSRFTVEGNSFSYNINGTIKHKNKKITRLVLQQSWYDKNKELLYRKRTSIVDENSDLSLRRGDKLAFSDFIHDSYPPDTLDSIQLTVYELETENDKDPLSEASPINLIWQKARPDGMNLSLECRKPQFIKGALNDFYQATYILKNEGIKSISALDIAPVWFSDDNRVRPSVEAYSVITSHDKPLDPGESRVISLAFQLPLGRLKANDSENYSFSVRIIK